jgi:hypothetical protein
MSRNLNEPASKDTLAQWVSLSLKKTLMESNIKKGFYATGIFPLDEHAVDSMLAPSDSFQGDVDSGEGVGRNVGRGGLHSRSCNEHGAGPLLRPELLGPDEEHRND